ncbi:O-antigen ligase family protein [Halosegnis rubeus]
MIIGGNASLDVAERCFKLILLTTVLISLFAITQALEFQFAVTTLGELYTVRSPRVVAISPTGTTSNPNTLGKLVLLPLFAFFGLFYRSIVSTGAVNILRTVLWGGSALLSGLIIILSDSRSALVGAILGLGIILCTLILVQLGSSKRRRLVIGGTAVTVLSGLILSIFVLDIGRIGDLQHPLEDNSLQRRFTKWEAILPIILERPLIGHGPSNRFIEEVSFRYIDSGVLSWLYHYGILGVLSYLYLVLGAVRLGVSGLSDENLFQERPVLWSASVAVLGWLSGTLAVWTVAGVPQSRRVFALVVFVAALVATHLHRSGYSA